MFSLFFIFLSVCVSFWWATLMPLMTPASALSRTYCLLTLLLDHTFELWLVLVASSSSNAAAGALTSSSEVGGCEPKKAKTAECAVLSVCVFASAQTVSLLGEVLLFLIRPLSGGLNAQNVQCAQMHRVVVVVGLCACSLEAREKDAWNYNYQAYRRVVVVFARRASVWVVGFQFANWHMLI